MKDQVARLEKHLDRAIKLRALRTAALFFVAVALPFLLDIRRLGALAACTVVSAYYAVICGILFRMLVRRDREISGIGHLNDRKSG